MATGERNSTNIFRILRRCLGLTTLEMAQRCKISESYLKELERGVKNNLSKDDLKKFADACGIKEETLSYFIEEQQGKTLDYQRKLLVTLEHLANKMRNSSDNED